MGKNLHELQEVNGISIAFLKKCMYDTISQRIYSQLRNTQQIFTAQGSTVASVKACESTVKSFNLIWRNCNRKRRKCLVQYSDYSYNIMNVTHQLPQEGYLRFLLRKLVSYIHIIQIILSIRLRYDVWYCMHNNNCMNMNILCILYYIHTCYWFFKLTWWCALHVKIGTQWLNS